MPANPNTTRFFALTAERLEAITLHRLTLADVKVWAYIELNAKPQAPIPFTLERIALALGLSVNTARRSLRRLTSAGLLVGRVEGNRHLLAPVGYALDGAVLPNRTTKKGAEQQDSLPTRRDREAETLPNRITEDTSKAGSEAISEIPPKKLNSRDKKISFNACALSQTLARDWGLYPAVAARLVSTYGQERVQEVIQWGEHLRAIGKLRSRGWVYQALTRGWGAPDTYHQTAHKAREGIQEAPQAQPVHQTPESLPERLLEAQEKRETLARMLAQPFPASKRLAAKLASDWGIDIQSLGDVAV